MEYINSSSTTSNSTSKVQLIRTVIKSGSRWQFEHEFSKNIVLQCLTPHLSFLNCQQADGREKTNVFFWESPLRAKTVQKTKTTKQSVHQWEIRLCITNCELYHKDTVEKIFFSIEKFCIKLQSCFSRKKLLTTKISPKNIVMNSKKRLNVLKTKVELLSLKTINNQIWLKLTIHVITTTKTFFLVFKLSRWRSRGKTWWNFWFVLLSSK